MPCSDVTIVIHMANRLRLFLQSLRVHKEKWEKCQRVLDTNYWKVLLENTVKYDIMKEVDFINYKNREREGSTYYEYNSRNYS